MTLETNVPTDASTEISAPETVETPEVTTPDAEGQEPQQEKPQLSDAEREAKALKRRVDRLTQQKYQLAAEVENLRRRPAAEQDDPKQEPIDPKQLEPLIERRAREIAQEHSQQQRLDTVNADLKKSLGASYDDFIEELSSAGSATPVLLRNAMEMDNSTQILAHLASDRDELDRVLRMPPIKQAAYMGRLSERLESKKPAVSTAPRPLTPITSRTASRSSPTLGDEDMVRAIRATR